MARRWIFAAPAGAGAALLSACGTTPSPEIAIPAENVQVRLTEAAGVVEGGSGAIIGGGVQGKSCILTVLGEAPPGVRMEQGGCRFETVAPATDGEGGAGGP